MNKVWILSALLALAMLGGCVADPYYANRNYNGGGGAYVSGTYYDGGYDRGYGRRRDYYDRRYDYYRR